LQLLWLLAVKKKKRQRLLPLPQSLKRSKKLLLQPLALLLQRLMQLLLPQVLRLQLLMLLQLLWMRQRSKFFVKIKKPPSGGFFFGIFICMMMKC